ncbi:Uncharacterised protein [Pseudomonas mucidolens]|nr:Uncharacterised protein [Pseudomonas mucidolens]
MNRLRAVLRLEGVVDNGLARSLSRLLVTSLLFDVGAFFQVNAGSDSGGITGHGYLVMLLAAVVECRLQTPETLDILIEGGEEFARA